MVSVAGLIAISCVHCKCVYYVDVCLCVCVWASGHTGYKLG